MGGQALKTAFTRRYSVDEYGRLVFKVTDMLGKLNIDCRIPKSFGAKESFGDLDVLILAKSLKERNLLNVIKDTFNPSEIYCNSDVYSFDYKEFQIDFILVKTKYWDSSYEYYSYNDLGNLIGRISYQMGLRYGHFGLKLVYRHDDGGKKFEEIISQDINEILDFLGFDVEKYHKGFHELNEVFDFVIESKYFNPRFFDYDVLNHQNRTRNKKRKNYTAFLDYVKERFDNSDRAFVWRDKNYYVDMIDAYFGTDIRSQIDSWNKEVEFEKKASERFNGKLIMERYPDLKGKELGNAISNFREFITKDYSPFMSNYKSKEHMYMFKILAMDDNEIWNIFEITLNK